MATCTPLTPPRPRRPRRWLGLLGAAALFTAAAPAIQAAPVTYAFTGVVDDDEAGRGYGGFSGSFTFDSAAIDAIADTSTAAYAHSGAPWGLTVAFDGGLSFTVSDSFNVLVSNDLLGMDQWGLLALDAAQSFSLTFTDLTALVFGNDALPLPQGGLSLAAFGASTLRWDSGDGALQGHMSSLACSSGCAASGEPPSPQPLPEPPSLSLAWLGMGILMAVRRRKAGARPCFHRLPHINPSQT